MLGLVHWKEKPAMERLRMQSSLEMCLSMKKVCNSYIAFLFQTELGNIALMVWVDCNVSFQVIYVGAGCPRGM